MRCAQNRPALGTRDRIAGADHPGTEVSPTALPRSHAAPAALCVGLDLRTALVHEQNRLIGRRLPIGFLEQAAALATPETAEGAVGKDDLAWAIVVAVAAPGTGRLAAGVPVALPVGMGIGRKHGIELWRRALVPRKIKA